jgi:hypothetical protein
MWGTTVLSWKYARAKIIVVNCVGEHERRKMLRNPNKKVLCVPSRQTDVTSWCRLASAIQ